MSLLFNRTVHLLYELFISNPSIAFRTPLIRRFYPGLDNCSGLDGAQLWHGTRDGSASSEQSIIHRENFKKSDISSNKIGYSSVTRTKELFLIEKSTSEKQSISEYTPSSLERQATHYEAILEVCLSNYSLHLLFSTPIKAQLLPLVSSHILFPNDRYYIPNFESTNLGTCQNFYNEALSTFYSTNAVILSSPESFNNFTREQFM